MLICNVIDGHPANATGDYVWTITGAAGIREIYVRIVDATMPDPSPALAHAIESGDAGVCHVYMVATLDDWTTTSVALHNVIIGEPEWSGMPSDGELTLASQLVTVARGAFDIADAEWSIAA